jgi:predicted deacylase
VFNILYHYNFLDDEIEQRPQTRATGFEHYRSSNGGLVNYEVDLGSRVTRGDALFQITDPFGHPR